MSTSQSRVDSGVPAGGQFSTSTRSESGVQLTAPEPQLDAMTPRDVDERMAALFAEQEQVLKRTDRATSRARSVLRHRKVTSRGRLPNEGWPTSPSEALSELRTKLNEGSVAPWDVTSAGTAVKDYDEAVADLRRIDDQVEDGEAEWERRGRWSRFFVVTSSAGGHIHSSRACSTCRPTTRFGWLPQLSGEDEPAAVEAHGAILCTVCFPSAPTEWTDGRGQRDKDGNVIEDTTCPGSNGPPAGETKRWGQSTYGTCPECGEQVTYGYSGLRKHKKK